MACSVTPVASHSRRVDALASLINLVRKEWRESSSALLVGTIVFGLLPLIWGVIYLLIDMQHEPGGRFGLMTLFVVGPLYALVVAAYTVCRDWGRAEEWFLLARPVTPRAAIFAKLIAAVVVLAVIFLCATVADAVVYGIYAAVGGDSVRAGFPSIPLMFAPAGAFLVLCIGVVLAGFAVTFAAAVITRQMLAATLLAGLLLCIGATAPAIWRPLAFLHPKLPPARGANHVDLLDYLGANRTFFAAIAACIVISVGAALLAATRERQIRIGHKALAWTIAGTVLVLFTGAMTEVGNSMTVLDTTVLPSGNNWGGREWLAATQGNACMILTRDDEVEASPDRKYWIGRKPIATFRVDSAGHVKDLRDAVIYYSTKLDPRMADGHFVHAAGLRFFSEVAALQIQNHDQFILTGLNDQSTPPHVVRMTILWPDGKEPRVVSSQKAVPFGPYRRDMPEFIESRSDLALLSFASTPEHLYAEYAERPKGEEAGADPTGWPRTLYAFEWSTLHEFNTRLGPVDRAPADTPAFDDLLAAAQAENHGQPVDWYGCRYFEPYRSRDKADPSIHFHPVAYGRVPAPMGGSARYRCYSVTWAQSPREIAYDQFRGVAFLGQGEGLFVYNTTSPQTPVIGECRATPLASLFRDSAYGLTMFDNGTAVENSGNCLTVYDVAAPSKPKRIGFFNIQGRNAKVIEVGDHMVLRQIVGHFRQDQLVVLGKPGSR